VYGLKAQFSPIEILLALLGLSILTVFLVGLNSLYPIRIQALNYANQHSQKMLQSTLKYETGLGSVSTMFVQYVCHENPGVKAELDRIVPELLNNFSRKNHNYILALKTTEGYLEEPRYYNTDKSVCLNSVTLTKQSLKACNQVFEIVLGTWEDGQEVQNC